MLLKRPLGQTAPAPPAQQPSGMGAVGVTALAITGIGIVAAALAGGGGKKKQAPLRGAPRRGCGCGR